MNDNEIYAMNQIIANGLDTMQDLDRFSSDKQIHITDSLLSYYNYRIMVAQPNPSLELKSKKAQILLRRLQLPILEEENNTAIELASPANSSPPSDFGIGYAVNPSETHTYQQLHWAPYSYDVLTRMGYSHDELVVLETTIGISNSAGIFVDKLELIRVRAFETMNIPIEGERKFSWQARIGIQRVPNTDSISNHDGVISFGIGKSIRFDASNLYLMADIASHDISDIRLEPNIGFIYTGTSMFRMELNYRSSFSLTTENKSESLSGQFHFQVNKNHGLRAELSTSDLTSLSLIYHYYW